jgi:hypothetical protein
LKPSLLAKLYASHLFSSQSLLGLNLLLGAASIVLAEKKLASAEKTFCFTPHCQPPVKNAAQADCSSSGRKLKRT